jgi:hypothetical protein
MCASLAISVSSRFVFVLVFVAPSTIRKTASPFLCVAWEAQLDLTTREEDDAPIGLLVGIDSIPVLKLVPRIFNLKCTGYFFTCYFFYSPGNAMIAAHC